MDLSDKQRHRLKNMEASFLAEGLIPDEDDMSNAKQIMTVVRTADEINSEILKRARNHREAEHES